ncbi:MAG: hypothetical protein JWN05_988 [Arthrobacter sp.]|jgi:hypothetical protein|nr:hypothetical protein [Arthrobacter sp.]
MEAVRDFLPFQDTDLDTDHSAGKDHGAGTARVQHPDVDGALTTLHGVSSTAVEDAAFWGFQAASDFAGQVEELSRTVEYLQLVAAAAVDRARKESAAAAATVRTSWTTGWRDSSSGSEAGSPGAATGTGAMSGAVDGAPGPEDSPVPAATSTGSGAAGAADDGYRNTSEFLRTRLRISASEARRRLRLAEGLLPRLGLGGQQLPPTHAELGVAVASGEVATRAATLITVALDRVRHACDAEAAGRMEHALTRTAAENDEDFLVRVVRSWTDAMDQDGAEPSEELLRQLQGAFIRRPRHGLHHVEIFATAEQFEHLLTVMNTATNPRTSTVERQQLGAGSYASPDARADGEGRTDGEGRADADARADGESAAIPATSGVSAAGEFIVVSADDPAAAALDLRSRPQKLLDGLVGACKVALTASSLPVTGGLRPQIMVTIDYRDLLTRLGEADTASGTASAAGRTPAQTGTLMFTGPITASTVRKIACDADIIPVLLGGEGRILDIGRASRIFPPHIRKAIAARDKGCAFPGCTIPAPWCEAHHISYWSRGGTSGTDNGTLLCSHHHHVIHKEQWTVETRTGIPWFIPPPHVDPRQRPRRNYYFRPADLPTAA